MSQRFELKLAVGTLVLFSLTACFMGLPGADGDACGTYNVITKLADSFTYTLSRTPGQPLLDYCNFVFWSFKGDGAVQAWYVLISSLGVIAMYSLVREAGGCSPIAAVASLALQPLFLAHVGGLGDFAVSLSFLLVALWAAMRGMPILSGLALALAVGCRLSFCIYVIPVAILIAFFWNARGYSLRRSMTKAASGCALAAAVSTVFYAPLFSFWGMRLLENFSVQSLRYHVSAFCYRLLVSLGLPFLVLVLAFIIVVVLRWRRLPGVHFSHIGVAWASAAVLVCGLITLFRVPTKPELALPILLATILLIQVSGTKAWAFAVLVTSIAIGLIVPSPYDRDRDAYGWHLGQGLYMERIKAAYDNRFQIRSVRRILAELPRRTILVTRFSWTDRQAKISGIRMIENFEGIPGLSVCTFQGIEGDRVAVHFQEPMLRKLLDYVSAGIPTKRMNVVYEEAYLGQLRRWMNLDLSKYGNAVEVPRLSLQVVYRQSFGDLLQ